MPTDAERLDSYERQYAQMGVDFATYQEHTRKEMMSLKQVANAERRHSENLQARAEYSDRRWHDACQEIETLKAKLESALLQVKACVDQGKAAGATKPPDKVP